MDRGTSMSLRQRFLLMFASVVFLVVGSVSWIVANRARRAFDQVDQQRTSSLVAQYRTEFDRHGQELSRDLDRLAKSERVQRIAFEVARGGDTSQLVSEAASFAQEYGFDYLDLATSDGTIISSAEFPAHFGYKLQLPEHANGIAALHAFELPTRSAVAIASSQKVSAGEGAVYLIAGRAIDRSLLQNFVVSQGAYLWLYTVEGAEPTSANLLGEAPVDMQNLSPLIKAAQAGHEISGAVRLSSDKFDIATVQSILLRDDQARPAVVLLIGTSRRPLLELQQQIRTAAFGIAGIGILLAVIASLWLAARFTRPIEQLAAASRELAAGRYDAHVDIDSNDEVGELAQSFNSMVSDLADNRDRLVQVERVAAWRELARRLAHELKNPLFPLQLTVENLAKAKRLTPEEFDEIFKESTATLLAEITNLKTIIGRFSDFSKMPKPQLQAVDLNDAATRTASLHQAQVAQVNNPIVLKANLATISPIVMADPELLHRVLSNLVLNAIDAMPNGGIISLTVRDEFDRGIIEVADTGTGLKPEERDRLFTPYYTTKGHGTGLGLAVAQSVISDHNGSITVQSEPGRGTTFTIHLPKGAAEAKA
jgi:two-component system, NtrC family, nitrogen regulation sensor histidine kinase NtrY